MKALVFLGSRRTSTPPKPARLGERVCAFLVAQLGGRFAATVVDPLDHPPTDIFKPAFAYPARSRPGHLAALEELIRAADAYVMVSPEYNHSMSPALADLLNHFPSSAYAFKPSLIATYSGGQWGGTRAAVNMRTFLSELGCIPVSAMLHVPHADQVLAPDGRLAPGQDEGRWLGYADRGIAQLHWWAAAAARQRQALDPFQSSPAFVHTPLQRDAPG
jgi:NAD(P)H-dependent FMN reductase